RQVGLSYSRFMNALKRAGIHLDRKVLAELAVTDPSAFAKLTENAKGHSRSCGGPPRVDAIVREARDAVAAAQSSAELERIRVGVLGRQGELTQLLRSLGTRAPEERPLVGARAHCGKG